MVIGRNGRRNVGCNGRIDTAGSLKRFVYVVSSHAFMGAIVKLRSILALQCVLMG